MSKPLYVFDMDETLINADCAMIWNEFMVEKGIVTEPDFIEEDQRLMGLYAQGKMDMEDYLAFSMKPLENMPIEDVNALVEECVESHILAKQFPQAKRLIEELSRDGIDMTIISASVTFLVKVVGRRLNIPSALGIDLIEKDNRYTAEIRGIPTYREGKVARLKQWLEAQPETYSDIHFYTDSINDLPLCEYANYTYLVNPCSRLKEHADKPNWSVLSWG
ncbi:HAD family hydrolase [Vibrio nigripulchritudo]|uniref:HAD family hydrolase n=1 Tax=Vibrio nigripulchritudo TaxID=28173 RepID=UPI0003B1A711|nr:HAD family hydrolase [Vibrio nigripulchritudo]CCN85996.1 HAD-superfamily subfamily IB hydrolase [Vibrio nigripulchritudo BLFn1]CCN97794.1 HAD-superfamily subfamily IB hydrolase [Vibrio nigripulchritudo ENn2]CCO56105.1 HAD-superfamily subfamily IB hydrolase [Vibrio nigripulchritudo Wn13]